MRHRVRAAALVFSKDRKSLLVIKHVHPETKREWWVPPGGGLEIEDRDLFQTAERETFEEAGITIQTTGKIKYIREFHEVSRDILHLELFVEAEYVRGETTIENIHGKGEDEHFIKEAAWLTRDQMKELLVFPEIVHEDSFWEENDEIGIYLKKQVEDKLISR
jgi:8-oxo-dGTP pyrophosphatase MutT (NUDIX family)